MHLNFIWFDFGSAFANERETKNVSELRRHYYENENENENVVIN